jgi:hypothetical protein
MEKQRIQVYADPETKRRIELAAAKHNIPVTEYCLNAIRQQLADEELLEASELVIPITPAKPFDETLVADLRALTDAILEARVGKPIDIDAFIEDMREERDYELTGLR